MRKIANYDFDCTGICLEPRMQTHNWLSKIRSYQSTCMYFDMNESPCSRNRFSSISIHVKLVYSCKKLLNHTQEVQDLKVAVAGLRFGGIRLDSTVLLRLSYRQIPLRYPGRRQARGWSQTCSELEFGLSSSSLAAS